MANIVQLADHRPPVWYEIAIEHHWDGTVKCWIKDLDDKREDMLKVASALRIMADQLEETQD